MDRKTERGQMMIEMLILTLMFAGFFFVAATLAKEGERKQEQYRFTTRAKRLK